MSGGVVASSRVRKDSLVDVLVFLHLVGFNFAVAFFWVGESKQSEIILFFNSWTIICVLI
jgi:hypothetical protein